MSQFDASKFENIPHEMREFKQWVLWKYEDKQSAKPTKVPYSIAHSVASVTDKSTWSSYADAIATLQQSDQIYNGIGFVLTDADPYAFIDLDDARQNADTMAKQHQIFNDFASYAERSPSGEGLHIIVKGSLTQGRRRNSIEIYSNARYMTMTGDVFRDAPIVDCTDKLNALFKQMSEGKSPAFFYAGLDPEKEPDETIILRATHAVNGEKFSKLNNGLWLDYYQSQSEADFALIDMFAFYTQNRAQIVRLFRKSGLGKRDKAKRPDYIGYMLDRAFDKIPPPIDFEAISKEALSVANNANNSVQLLSKSNVISFKPSLTSAAIKIKTDKRDLYSWPAGLTGELAKFIYEAAPRPVPEIALAGAIGLMAGICGRAYNVSGTGLNQYVLLLAATGVGKESIASGIDKLMNAVQITVPSAIDFIGPSDIASRQALLKYLARESSSFVSIVGEFGLMLQQMSDPRAPSHMIGLRAMLLDLYNKSGKGKLLRPSIYSDAAKNTEAVASPSMTILGESTPERFYQALHTGMIAEGLLPRFTVIEYLGPRPALNEHHASYQPSFELIEMLATLCSQALMLNSQKKCVDVQCDSDADALFKKFDIEVDERINCTGKDLNRQLWNRAHIKALKLAATLAVGCNPYNPIIDHASALWAIQIITRDVTNLLERFEGGEVGMIDDESEQFKKFVEVIREYLTMAEISASARSRGVNEQRLKANVIPYSYLQWSLYKSISYKRDRQGALASIKKQVMNMIAKGDIAQVSVSDAATQFGARGQLFAITNPEAFKLDD